MNRLKYTLFLVAVILIIGCEDVIDIDSETSGGDLVVDGWINTNPEEQTIKLTLSQGFFDNTPPPSVDNATVTVTNLTQNRVHEFVDAAGSGDYKWSGTGGAGIATVGDQLKLTIQYQNDTYTATTTVKRVPTIDSIGQEFRDDEIFLDDGIYVQFFARDFVGKGDAYWIKSFKNGIFLNDAAELNIAYDAGFDAGSQIDGITFIPPIRELVNELDEDGLDIPWNPGENVRIEIHSLSNEAFNFLEIARDQINNGSNGIFSLPLANARSNIRRVSDDKSILGFFNVAAVSSMSRSIE